MSNEVGTFGKELALWDHMRYNFYPPISLGAIENWIRMFKKYWDREITYERFVELCPVEEDELVHRFGTFFYEEDLEWEE